MREGDGEVTGDDADILPCPRCSVNSLVVTASAPRPAHRTLRRLLTVAPGRADLVPAVRIAAGLAGPLLLLLATGHLGWALFASFGAFTGIYSRYEPTRLRWRRQVLMGLVLVACVGIGSLIAHVAADAPTAGMVLRLLVPPIVAGAAAGLVRARGLKPSGGLFPLFSVGAVAAAPVTASVAVAVLVAAASAAWCVGLGLLTHLLGEAHPDAEEAPAPRLGAGELVRELARYAVAAGLGGAAGLLSGLPSPSWAQLAAIVPLSAPGRSAQVERGLHRVIGTGLGVVVTAFLLSFPTQPWQLVVWVVLLQFLAEMFVLRNYSLALIFITPLALLMVQLGHPQPVGPMLTARVAETTLGVAVGLAVVLVGALADTRGGRGPLSPRSRTSPAAAPPAAGSRRPGA